VNVLVVFYSTEGETERLALTAGVGAIQGHASIRLRRLPPEPPVQPGEMTASARETFERLSRDYVAPRPVDAEWADALILGTSKNGRTYLEQYLEHLPTIASVAAKIAAPIAVDTASDLLKPIYAAAAAGGLIVVPMAGPLDSIDARHAFGRHVVALASALKAVL
jgi:hypothetical protein